MSNLNVITLLLQTSLAVQIVVGFLLILAVASWVLIFRVAGRINGLERFDEEFEIWLWGGDGLQSRYQMVSDDFHRVGLEQIFYIGYDEFMTAQKITNNHAYVLQVTERKFNVILTKQKIILKDGLSTLSNISTIAPYLGVLGAVWGMVGALNLSGDISFGVIIPDIIEALLIIALGIFITISTKWALNYFNTRIEAIHSSRELFCEELIGVLSHQYMITQKAQQHQLPAPTQTALPSEPALLSEPNPQPKLEPKLDKLEDLTILEPELEELNELESELMLELDSISTTPTQEPHSHNLIK